MAKKADFKDAIGEIIDDKVQTDREPVQEIFEKIPGEASFILEKKKKKKNTKKSFPLYMEEDKVNELDKLCNKTGYTRNELINMMIDYSLKNLQIK